MTNINFSKNKMIFVIIAAVILIAGAVVLAVFGFADDPYVTGYTTYTAAFSTEGDYTDIDAAVLCDEVKSVVGNNASVIVTVDGSTYESILNITVPNGAVIDEQGVITLLDTNYPATAVDSLTNRSTDGSATPAFYVIFAIVLIVLIAVMFVISLFSLSTRNSGILVLCEVISVLLVTAIYALARVPSLMMLFASIFAAVLLTYAFGITRLKALDGAFETVKKPNLDEIVNSAVSSSFENGETLLIVAALLAVSLITVAIVFGYILVVYLAAMMLATVIFSLYSTTLIAPSVWAANK